MGLTPFCKYRIETYEQLKDIMQTDALKRQASLDFIICRDIRDNHPDLKLSNTDLRFIKF